MTAAIVKNYLAVLGKSYYTSKDFSDLGLKISPISKFGVGLLSCFEIAESVEIETQYDQSLEVASGLKILINDFNRQFKVQKTTNVKKTGTSIIVHVKGHKWRHNEHANATRLEVTKYLKQIAGFVPFPIDITEDKEKTVIISAAYDASQIGEIQKQYTDHEIYQTDQQPWLDEIVSTLDKDKAKQAFVEKHFPFTHTIDSVELTGNLTYFDLHQSVKSHQLSNHSRNNTKSAQFNLNNSGALQQLLIAWESVENHQITDLNATSVKAKGHAKVFLKGILLPEVTIAIYSLGSLPAPRINLNIIPNNNEFTPLVSRKGLHQSLKTIEVAVQKLCHEQMLEVFHQQFTTANHNEKIELLGRVDWKMIDAPLQYDWPVYQLTASGRLLPKLISELPDVIEVMPMMFATQLRWQQQTSEWPPRQRLKASSMYIADIVSSDFIMLPTGLGNAVNTTAEWQNLVSCINNICTETYQTHSFRLAKSNGNTFLVERKKAGCKLPEPNISPKQLPSFISTFSPFEGELDQYSAVTRIFIMTDNRENCYGPVYNSNHQSIQILQKVIESCNQSLLTATESNAAKIHNIFDSQLSIHPFDYQ